jgi:hypothetical protein
LFENIVTLEAAELIALGDKYLIVLDYEQADKAVEIYRRVAGQCGS